MPPAAAGGLGAGCPAAFGWTRFVPRSPSGAMTDAPGRGRGPGGRLSRRRRLDSLPSRLALGFLGVALAAIALLAGLTVTFASADVSSLVHRQRDQLTGAIAAAAAAGWDRRDSWAGADLS